MGFSSLDLADDFVTGYQDPNKELFEPILSNAKTFDVAVGYFCSGWLNDVMSGLKTFALNGGKCRFIVSPHLDINDAEKIICTEENQCLSNIELFEIG